MSETLERHSPLVVIVAGPNGAGKTTASQQLLQDELRVNHFVNADAIAKGLSAFDPDSVAMEAGRIMIQRIDKLGAAREDFAFETTLASRTNAPRVQALRETGYRCHLIFLYLPSGEQAIERVAGRVAAGGHNIPTETIRLRHERGLRNFFALYKRLADGWHFYDNSRGGPPRLIAGGCGEDDLTVADATMWQAVRQRYAGK